MKDKTDITTDATRQGVVVKFTHYDIGNSRVYYRGSDKNIYCKYDDTDEYLICCRNGEPSHPVYNIIEKKDTPEHIEIINELEKKGITRYQISKQTGITEATLCVWLKNPDRKPNKVFVEMLKILNANDKKGKTNE